MLPNRDAPFAMLRREGRDHVEILTGPVQTVELLADIPVTTEVLALVPYRQVRERGFACVDDGTPLSVLRVDSRTEATLEEVLAALPEAPIQLAGGGLAGDGVNLSGGGFDIDDTAYAATVGAVLRDEIGRGEGSNFVIHRVFEADIDGDPVTAALAVFRRLLQDERGAYWTFIVHTGQSTLVGATPERHVSVEDGLILMNPISGTYRHAAGAPDRAELLRFLDDRKEIDELSMVLDEELKMMATVADLGGQVIGPYLKEMTHLIHTEYLLAGRGTRDVRDVLRETMFAPTVVGSPLENACRVVARHERRGRGYYGGVLALIGRDEGGGQTLDAPILIRTAEIDHSGRLRVPVGATLVRHSTAEAEVAETHAKAAGILAALGGTQLAGYASAKPAPAGARLKPAMVEPSPVATRVEPSAAAARVEPAPTVVGPLVRLAADPEIQAALVRRNATLAPFWLQARDGDGYLDPALRGRRVLIVDAEDTFTGMLTHQFRVLGLSVTLRSHLSIGDTDGFDLVVPGPGPGDPRAHREPKMATMRALVSGLLVAGRPTLAVCLGHQILAAVLGLSLRRNASPYQGMQRTIDFFGRPAVVGFYSTFSARAASDWIDTTHGPVQVSRDPVTGDVYALRGPTFAGVQFHPESVLSEHGIALVRDLVTSLLRTPVEP